MFNIRHLPFAICDGSGSMNLRRLIVLALGIVFSGAVPAGAAEQYLEFVRGLREREYYDYALIYLDQLEKRADVPKPE